MSTIVTDNPLRQTILSQYDKAYEDNEGDIICPSCGCEIMQYFCDGADKYIEKGLCPICDCDKEFEDAPYDWCHLCDRHDWCESWQERAAEIAEFEFYDVS